jgi:uncharacterized membrane protein YhaH (DUF805 family)
MDAPQNPKDYYFKVIRNYANFDGRARRSEFWFFMIVNMLIINVLPIVGKVLFTQNLPLIYSLAVLSPSIAVSFRRMHDVGKPGWYALIPVYSIILAATAGDKGPNQYGTDPKTPDAHPFKS